MQLVGDYHPSRFACYLIAQNGDSRKPEIAIRQILVLTAAPAARLLKG